MKDNAISCHNVWFSSELKLDFIRFDQSKPLPLPCFLRNEGLKTELYIMSIESKEGRAEKCLYSREESLACFPVI